MTEKYIATSPRPGRSGMMTADVATPEWPVAPIPTAPAPNHPTGIYMPLRWVQHGDLRIVVDEPDVFLSSVDLYTLAGLDQDVHPHPTLRPHVTWAKNEGDPLLELYPLDAAITVLEHAQTEATSELLTWLRDWLPVYIAPEILDAAVGLESFCDSYTVAAAAMILDRDPAVSIGQRSLFRHLELLDWAHRDLAGIWQATSTAIRGRYLTIRDVIIRPGRTTTVYRQLYVTKAGLAELRHTLHALHREPVDQPAPQTLPIDE